MSSDEEMVELRSQVKHWKAVHHKSPIVESGSEEDGGAGGEDEEDDGAEVEENEDDSDSDAEPATPAGTNHQKVTPVRSSSRIRARPGFRMPSREEELGDIPTQKTPEKLRKMTPRKLVNRFSRESHRYNQEDIDPCSSDSEVDDFIADDESTESEGTDTSSNSSQQSSPRSKHIPQRKNPPRKGRKRPVVTRSPDSSSSDSEEDSPSDDAQDQKQRHTRLWRGRGSNSESSDSTDKSHTVNSKKAQSSGKKALAFSDDSDIESNKDENGPVLQKSTQRRDNKHSPHKENDKSTSKKSEETHSLKTELDQPGTMSNTKFTQENVEGVKPSDVNEDECGMSPNNGGENGKDFNASQNVSNSVVSDDESDCDINASFKSTRQRSYSISSDSSGSGQATRVNLKRNRIRQASVNIDGNSATASSSEEDASQRKTSSRAKLMKKKRDERLDFLAQCGFKKKKLSP